MIKFLAGGPGDPVPLWEQPGSDAMSTARLTFESDTRHATIARRMQGLRRYSVSRATATQPQLADPARVPPRIAELWWDSLQAIEDCFNSQSGLADLADAMVRFPASPVSIPDRMSGPNLCFVEGTDFDVAQPAAFRFQDGEFRGRPILTKLYGFVRVSDPEAFDDWYLAEAVPAIRDLANTRGHVLDRLVPQVIRIGNIVRGDQHSGERVVNIWFDDVPSIDAAAATVAGADLFSALAARVASVDWISMLNQEIFFSYDLAPELYGIG